MFPMKRLTSAALAALALAACKETISPDAVDTGALTDKVATIATTFDNNAAYQAMTSLSFSFPQFGGTNLVARLREVCGYTPTITPELRTALYQFGYAFR